MKAFRFTIPEAPSTAKEKERRKKKVGQPVVQGWMLLLGLFWMFRFWTVWEETLWFITLDIYTPGETTELVNVSLARDGMLSLLAGVSLLTSYIIVISRNHKQKKVEPAGSGQPM